MGFECTFPRRGRSCQILEVLFKGVTPYMKWSSIFLEATHTSFVCVIIAGQGSKVFLLYPPGISGGRPPKSLFFRSSEEFPAGIWR